MFTWHKLWITNSAAGRTAMHAGPNCSLAVPSYNSPAACPWLLLGLFLPQKPHAAWGPWEPQQNPSPHTLSTPVPDSPSLYWFLGNKMPMWWPLMLCGAKGTLLSGSPLVRISYLHNVPPIVSFDHRFYTELKWTSDPLDLTAGTLWKASFTMAFSVSIP